MDIEVEVVFATADKQALCSVSLRPGATVADAIATSRLAQRFPEQNLDTLEVGIWGTVVARDRPLNHGDRVEIYRPLAMDPREARRQLALAGRTMGNSERD